MFERIALARSEWKTLGSNENGSIPHLFQPLTRQPGLQHPSDDSGTFAPEPPIHRFKQYTATAVSFEDRSTVDSPTATRLEVTSPRFLSGRHSPTTTLHS